MDATPARHTQGGVNLLPVGLKVGTWDTSQYSGRGRPHRKASALGHVCNAAGVCIFAHISYEYYFIPDFLTAVTGRNWTVDDCYVAGDRIAHTRHAFTLREGLNPLEFKVPDRLLGNPPLTHGN